MNYIGFSELGAKQSKAVYFAFIARILYIVYPRHDYSCIRNMLEIPMLLSRRQDANELFITSFFTGTLDVSDS